MAVTKAYILNDGNIISEKTLERYAIKESKKLPSDVFAEVYGSDGLVEPLYNLEALAQLLELNTYHYRACKTKARDTAGLGWTLQPVDENASDGQWEIAMNLLENPSPDRTLAQIFDMVMVDYEATGNGYIEVIRGDDGMIIGLEHIPAHTMRVHQSGEKYCQIRNNKKRWFKKFGIETPINFETGEMADDVPEELRGNEVIHIMNYTSRSDFYGLPDILPALGSLLADRQRQEYNIAFFENYAVPAYVVTIIGADLDEEVEQKIKRYFQEEIKNNRHSTLVLTANKAEGDYGEDKVEINFQPVSTEVKEASFRLFRQDNRDEILAAHGVPPYRAGIAVVGNLGGTTAQESTKIYKQSIIEPRQEMLEGVVNRFILQQGLGVTEWKFKFNEIDTDDRNQEIENYIKLFNIGVYSPNQILDKLGEEPIDDPNMDRHYINGRPIDLSEEETGIMLNSLKQLHAKLVEIAAKGKNCDV